MDEYQVVYELQVAQRALGQFIKTLPTFKAQLTPSPVSVQSRDMKRTEDVRTDDRKATIPTEGYMRLAEVLSVFPVSRSTWWAGISAGRFPKGVKLGPRITAWKVEDIRKLIESSK